MGAGVSLLKAALIFFRGFDLFHSLPKTIDFFFVLWNAVIETVRDQINAIPFIFFQADVPSFEIRIAA